MRLKGILTLLITMEEKMLQEKEIKTYKQKKYLYHLQKTINTKLIYM